MSKKFEYLSIKVTQCQFDLMGTCYIGWTGCNLKPEEINSGFLPVHHFCDRRVFLSAPAAMLQHVSGSTCRFFFPQQAWSYLLSESRSHKAKAIHKWKGRKHSALVWSLSFLEPRSVEIRHSSCINCRLPEHVLPSTLLFFPFQLEMTDNSHHPLCT